MMKNAKSKRELAKVKVPLRVKNDQNKSGVFSFEISEFHNMALTFVTETSLLN